MSDNSRIDDHSNEGRLWDSIHRIERRTIVAETEINLLKDRTDNSLNQLILRQDKQESRFEKTFEKMTDSLVGIEVKLESFISKTKAESSTQDSVWKIVIALGIPALGLVGFLVNKYIESMK